MYKILKKEVLNKDVELIVVEAPYVSRNCQPGQFVIVVVEEDGERVPLTIQDFDREKGTISLIYQVVGFSTRLLGEKKVGDSIAVVVGPLGQPAHYPEGIKKVVAIGGGVGLAPLFPQVRYLKELGCEVDVILGGRSTEYVILQKEFAAVADRLLIATDDGSLGTKGFVTTVLQEQLANNVKYDFAIAIGPMVMMNAIVKITKPINLATNVSLNPLMIDGTGMCGLCRVKIGGETKFACVDGPDFDGFLVDFDEAARRQGFYKEEEHNCKIGRG